MGPEFLVTKEELRKAFKRLGSSNKKALRPDGILGGVIAKTAGFFLEDWASCFTACLRKGRFPNARGRDLSS